jgi:LPXTG-site transpeptidase (sortase) family protein
MKKIISLFVFLMILAGAVWYFVGAKVGATPRVTQVVQSVQTKITSYQTEQNSGIPVMPERLVIPKLDIDAPVESVGQDSQGRMDIPKADEDVGWYNMGYKPGENGSAVMAGHFDTKTGAPAVFYNINKLAPGDTLKVVGTNGETLTYIVTRAEAYAFDKVPLTSIFATKGKAQLNLITCDGVWSAGAHNYSQRLVVYSELKQ